MKTLKKLTTEGIPQDVKSAVNAYLMARAMAECETDKVTAIQTELLATADYWPDEKWLEQRGVEKAPIRNPKHSYLMKDEEFHSYLSDLRFELEAAGYDIKQTADSREQWCYLCPALTAQSVQRSCEWLLIECGAAMLGIENPEDMNSRLLCCVTKEKSGLEHRQEFIDLIVKAVVSLPDYKNPLTGEQVAA